MPDRQSHHERRPSHHEPPESDVGRLLREAARNAEEELSSLWKENRHLRSQLATMGAQPCHRPVTPTAVVEPSSSPSYVFESNVPLGITYLTEEVDKGEALKGKVSSTSLMGLPNAILQSPPPETIDLVQAPATGRTTPGNDATTAWDTDSAREVEALTPLSGASPLGAGDLNANSGGVNRPAQVKTGWLSPVVPALQAVTCAGEKAGMRQMRQLHRTNSGVIDESGNKVRLEDDSVSESGGGPNKRHSGASAQTLTSKTTLGVQKAAASQRRLSQAAASAGDGRTAVFMHAEEMKQKVRKAIGRPEYSVSDYYKNAGLAQWIARHHIFDMATLTVIGFNAIWIGVSTELNHHAVLSDAEWPFQVGEHFFCTYFFFEWWVRFLSFADKRNCVQDYWFLVDSSLAWLMVLETWVITVLFAFMGPGGATGSGVGNTSMLRILRLLRLTRMARMVRLLRAMPELMVMVKGLSVAMRSVLFTLCLLMGIIYVFSIMFVEAARGTKLELTYFSSVPRAMSTLLISSAMPDLVQHVDDMYEGHIIFAVLFLIFILLASLTVMNMLVGVLVEVVSVVSAVEKEQMDVLFVRNSIKKMIEDSGADADNDQRISKAEFVSLLQNPDAARALQKIGVDVVGLVDYTEFLFVQDSTLTFGDFMETILELRGSNSATVKDIVDLRKFLVDEIMGLEGKLNLVLGGIRQSTVQGPVGGAGPRGHLSIGPSTSIVEEEPEPTKKQHSMGQLGVTMGRQMSIKSSASPSAYRRKRSAHA